VEPLPNVSAFTAFRMFWLAEKGNARAGGANVDLTGDSGRFIGSQLELRLRWDLLPQNVRLEGG
jgi:hypothetical protein